MHRSLCVCGCVRACVYACMCVWMCVSWIHCADWFIAVPGDGAWEQQSLRVLFSSTTEATNLIIFFSSTSSLEFAWETPPPPLPPPPPHTHTHTHTHTHSYLTQLRTASPLVPPACIMHLHLPFCFHSASLVTVIQQRYVLLCWDSSRPFMVCTLHDLPLCILYIKHPKKKPSGPSSKCFYQPSVCCSTLTMLPGDVSQNLSCKLEYERNWTWKCRFIYPTKALCLYSPLFSNPHWVRQWTLRSSHQGEIKQGVSQWHSASDNGTMEVLSITALSLEKSSQKGVSLVTLSHVFLFILTFKSVFL